MEKPDIKNVKTTVYKPDKSKDGYQLLSDCCSYPPTSDGYYEGGRDGDGGYISGYCSRCKDGTCFQWYKDEE